MLDRNGRAGRYFITKNDMMVVASETGTFAVEASEIREKGRLRPGKILMIDTEKGEIRYDPEIKERSPPNIRTKSGSDGTGSC